MTLEEMKASDIPMLTCLDVSEVIGANPYNIHEQAIERPELLGFPVSVVGKKVKIPRLAFLHFMGVNT